MTRRVLIGAAVLLVLLIAAVGAALFRAQRARRAAGAMRVRVSSATGERIRVEVLNTTPTRGLARRAMFYLRDHGFDVVQMGNSTGQRDSTLVLDRSNHPAWASRVAGVLGGARVESRPDSSRYLDVTVLLGRSWRPPPQPFYP